MTIEMNCFERFRDSYTVIKDMRESNDKALFSSISLHYVKCIVSTDFIELKYNTLYKPFQLAG
jgi:hypothetical protein